ncbi:probable phosphoserine aminotransferase [Toxorhynchites rutilus septentrionalis]|uniref:probable phosphoserine aminotransferase n=1 Tax=Toxorhynchites rutilus septentrionalis TaxID=329112 RepID=UPI0024788BE7|nr:probable phosphoserine aminotransferase [Toxorhynchites rutilus septentrionalis]
MVINFGAGPAKLPRDVLLEVQKTLVDYGTTGMSVMEMSHRGTDYVSLHNETIELARELLKVPENYKVLLMQGGGTGLFAAVAMNLIGRTGSADYLVTGSWSAKAAKEAAKYGKVNQVASKPVKFTSIPRQNDLKLDPNASYLYYCDNETIEGVEFDYVPETNGVPLVVDMSSNIMSRTVDIKKFGVIFACAQKNIGPAGITLVIAREDLIGHQLTITPTILDFSIIAKDNSINNTPPTFIIYVVGRVFAWIKRHGGLDKMYQASVVKSNLIYEAISASNDYYSCPVESNVRSRMNVPFRIGGPGGNETLEKEFLKGAEALGMEQLKGHRSVGGIRASLYNAVSIEEADTLSKYMVEFQAKHTQ